MLRHLLGVGKLGLGYGKDGAVLGVPRPAIRLGPWGSQALGHPGAAGSRRRAENRVVGGGT